MSTENAAHQNGVALPAEYRMSDDGKVSVPAIIMNANSYPAVKKSMEEYKWRDNDFLLAAFPKNGTHFMWEVMTMLLRGSSDYIKESKVVCMIDAYPVTESETLFPSPRVLNSHYRLDVLPKEFRGKKTVCVLRNPKDSAVSMFHHDRTINSKLLPGLSHLANMPFSQYLRERFLFNKEIPYGNYFDYVEYMWSLKDEPNVLVVFYEDLKRNPINTIQKVNEFMGTQRSAELVQQIADATNFKKMRDGKSAVFDANTLDAMDPQNVSVQKNDLSEMVAKIYRKGEIGDWKNHFTVADNELFDSVLEKWSVWKEIPFKS